MISITQSTNNRVEVLAVKLRMSYEEYHNPSLKLGMSSEEYHNPSFIHHADRARSMLVLQLRLEIMTL